jgi:hypothetical protein
MEDLKHDNVNEDLVFGGSYGSRAGTLSSYHGTHFCRAGLAPIVRTMGVSQSSLFVIAPFSNATHAWRNLLVRTYIMLRHEIDYAEFVRRGVAVRSARVSNRPQVPGKLIERLASEQQLS